MCVREQWPNRFCYCFNQYYRSAFARELLHRLDEVIAKITLR